jgi:hypothetical protein
MINPRNCNYQVKKANVNRGDIILGVTIYSVTADTGATMDIGWDANVSGTTAARAALIDDADIAAAGVDVGTAVHQVVANDGWVTVDTTLASTWTGTIVLSYIPGIAK